MSNIAIAVHADLTRNQGSDVPRIQLPHNGWVDRPYQDNLWEFLQAGGKRAIAIWHRRAGKDDIALHYAAVATHMRVGNLCIACRNTLRAAKRSGRPSIRTPASAVSTRRFRTKLRETTNDNEMFIRFKNGSTWQVIGSDRYNATVGSSPMGITYSEWALANPSCVGLPSTNA